MTAPRPLHDLMLPALAVLGLALGGCGGPSGDALYEAARVALEAGALEKAATAVAQAQETDAERYGALGDFLRGNIAFERSKRAEVELLAPVPDPRALQVTITHAEDALVAWQKAASSRANWPAARRNAERALLRLEQLQERRRAERKGKPRVVPGGKPKPDETKKPDPPPRDPAQPEAPEGDPESTIETGRLAGDAVPGLFELLAKKQREKLKMRRAQRRTGKDKVERDW